MKYLENEDDNLNPILRKIFADGYTFYGIKEKNDYSREFLKYTKFLKELEDNNLDELIRIYWDSHIEEKDNLIYNLYIFNF